MKKVFNILNKIVNKLKALNTSYIKFSSKKTVAMILQFFPRNLYLMILFVILLLVTIPKFVNNDIIKYKTDNFDVVYEEITKDKIEQKINTKNIENIDELGVLFATYMRENNSLYQLEIYEDDTVIYSKKFNAKKLKDNSYKYFETNISKIKSNSEYKYVLTPIKVKKGEGITVYQNDDKEFAYAIRNKSEFYIETIIISIVFLILFFIINYIINNKKIRTEKGFILLMLIYIIPILFIYPVYETPDEPVHFYKSLRLSQYNILKTPYENMVKKKVEFPKNYKCLNYSNAQTYESVNDKDKFLDCFNQENNINVKIPAATTNNILVYIPSAIGIKIMDVFTDSPMLIFYAGRLCNLLVSFLILLYAFKILPKHKKMFMMVIFIPMFIQQMISYSYDSILNSLCVLIISYLIKFYNSNNRISKKELIIYTLVSILIFNIKSPYVLLALPIFLLDKEKFGKGKHDKLKKIIFIMVSIILSDFLLKYISSIGVTSISESTVSTRGNPLSSLFNIKHLLIVIYSTILNTGMNHIISMIGIFGWLSTGLNLLLIYAYLFMLILGVLSEESNLKLKYRLINIALIIILIGGIFLAMYLYWTPTGNTIIEGVQGRYFLPVLLLLMAMLTPKKRKIELEDDTIYSFINISMIIYICTLLFSFY